MIATEATQAVVGLDSSVSGSAYEGGMAGRTNPA